jgi:hypothetical protein
VNLLRNNTDDINKNTESLINASKEVGLGANAEKTTNMLVSRDQNADQMGISLEHRSLENMTKNKQTPWPLVRERTIPTERPPLVDEI